MKSVGPIIKKHIEANGLKKCDVAAKAGISYNYLSTIFKQDSCDAELLERICFACGLHPADFFDDNTSSNFGCDNSATTIVGDATISVGSDAALRELLAEKERTIRILLRSIENGTKTGHIH